MLLTCFTLALDVTLLKIMSSNVIIHLKQFMGTLGLSSDFIDLYCFKEQEDNDTW